MLQLDVVRASASLAVSDGTVADGSGSHLVRVRLNGKPIELEPGKKLWVHGWGTRSLTTPSPVPARPPPVTRSRACGFT